MHLAIREWQASRRWRVPLSALCVGLLLGVTGPFGSQSAYTPQVRYAFWMTAALAGFAAAAGAERLIPPQAVSGRLTRLVAVAAASAVPMTFFVAWLMGVAAPGRVFGPIQLLGLFPFVALVQLLIARVLSPDPPMAPIAAEGLPVAAPHFPAELLTRLPPALRRDIIALEAEDHYLRVHTLHGSALVLMRLADAAALIDPRLGLRVHRSWWVAKAGVGMAERTSGRLAIRLIDDTIVPVSRTHLPAVRAAFGDAA